MKAVFDRSYVTNLDGKNVKTGANKYDLAMQVIEDIENFKRENNCNRVVIVWCGSTEKYIESTDIHSSIEKFEAALKNNESLIAPSMIYAYAAIKTGVPFANGAPNLTCDIPALIELAKETNTPIGEGF